MNYTINYQSSGGPSAVPMNQQGQRTIFLSPPSQNTSGNNNQQSFPMVMQVQGSSHQPVFYTYQTNDGLVNSAVPSKVIDSANNSNNYGLGQVMLSPVSPVQKNINIVKQNGNSPTVPMVNIQTENCSAVRSLGDVFNVQQVSAINNPGSLATSNSIPSNVSQGSPDLAKLISSLQAARLQIVETGVSPNSTTMQVPLVNSPPTASEQHSPDKLAMHNFVTSLQSAGIHVMENSSDNTMSISLPNRSVNESSFIAGTPVTGDKIFRVVDGSAGPGNVTYVTNGAESSISEGSM